MKVDKENDVLNCALTRYEFDREQWKLVLQCYNEIEYPADLRE